MQNLNNNNNEQEQVREEVNTYTKNGKRTTSREVSKKLRKGAKTSKK